MGVWENFAVGSGEVRGGLKRLCASLAPFEPKRITTEGSNLTKSVLPVIGFEMNRWLLIASMSGLLAITTGCLHHNTRGGCSTCSDETMMSGCGNCGGCQSGNCGGDCQMAGCPSGNCSNETCSTGNCGPSGCGLIGKGRGRLAGCRTGCQAGPLGWQQGGLNYSSHLNPGFLGHHAGQAVAGQPFQAGAPAAQVAYPYYTHRGPRDFLLDNPPSIGP